MQTELSAFASSVCKQERRRRTQTDTDKHRLTQEFAEYAAGAWWRFLTPAGSEGFDFHEKPSTRGLVGFRMSTWGQKSGP